MRKKVVEIKPADRQTILEERRRLKMARSAHAYVRGNTLQFYEWLKADSARKLPQGPPVWICGDCHVGNLGPVANSDSKVEIEIRDLDQTVIGNPAHDLIRLGLSLATAARGSDLPGVTTALMMEQMVQGYCSAMVPQRAKKRTKDPKNLRPVETVLHQAVNREWRHLAQERIEDVKPTIPLGDRFWALSDEEKAEITKLFETEDARKLITSLKHRDNNAKVRVLDAAYWMKGCSSLGRLRSAALRGLGPKKEKEYASSTLKRPFEPPHPLQRTPTCPKT